MKSRRLYLKHTAHWRKTTEREMMKIDLGMVQLKVGAGGETEVQYNVTPVMVNAAMAEARRLNLSIVECDMHNLLHAALKAG